MNKKELSLSEIQAGSLRILKTIDKVCNILNLRYFLAYGTLIGAIRHKNFIPWDDDIDIMMPRDDYKLLIDYFIKHKDELTPLELFSYYNNPKYPYMISRISDNRFYLDVENEEEYGIGLFVDIYPMDGIGNTEIECKKRKRKASKYSSLCFLSTRKHYKIGFTKGKKLFIKRFAYIYAKIIGKIFFLNKLEKMSEEMQYDQCTYVGCLVWGTDGIKAVFPKKWFEHSIDVEFGGSFFKAPENYHEVLTRLYGNYMQIPPKEKQISHHSYRAYKR